MDPQQFTTMATKFQSVLDEEVLNERGKHLGFATRERLITPCRLSLSVIASMATQHAKWLDESSKLPWRKPIPSLNVLLTSTCWRNDHNGFSHQGPGFMDTIVSKKGTVLVTRSFDDDSLVIASANDCVRQWTYRPGSFQGKPVASWLNAGVEVCPGPRRVR